MAFRRTSSFRGDSISSMMLPGCTMSALLVTLPSPLNHPQEVAAEVGPLAPQLLGEVPCDVHIVRLVLRLHHHGHVDAHHIPDRRYTAAARHLTGMSPCPPWIHHPLHYCFVCAQLVTYLFAHQFAIATEKVVSVNI